MKSLDFLIQGRSIGSNLLVRGFIITGLLVAPGCFAQELNDSAAPAGGGSLPAPPKSSSSSTPNGVEMEIGVASRIWSPAGGNYQSSNGVLSMSNLGRATPQLLTGLGFSCDTDEIRQAKSVTDSTNAKSGAVTLKNAYCGSRANRLGAFVSVQFGSGSKQTISGYSIGATYAVHAHLRLLVGFSLTPSSEISPGFANATAQYAIKYPSLFPGVKPANLQSNAYGAFDGIQFTSIAPPANAAPTSTIYYPGAPTETRYRGGLVIGVAMPINIFSLFQGNNKTN